MTRLELAIYRSAPFRKVFAIARRSFPPGFEGLSLFAAGKIFFKEVKSTKVNERGAAVTYNFLMAIPPTLLFLFSLVPYLPLGCAANDHRHHPASHPKQRSAFKPRSSSAGVYEQRAPGHPFLWYPPHDLLLQQWYDGAYANIR